MQREARRLSTKIQRGRVEGPYPARHRADKSLPPPWAVCARLLDKSVVSYSASLDPFRLLVILPPAQSGWPLSSERLFNHPKWPTFPAITIPPPTSGRVGWGKCPAPRLRTQTPP